jgi:hypothetical protein
VEDLESSLQHMDSQAFLIGGHRDLTGVVSNDPIQTSGDGS